MFLAYGLWLTGIVENEISASEGCCISLKGKEKMCLRGSHSCGDLVKPPPGGIKHTGTSKLRVEKEHQLVLEDQHLLKTPPNPHPFFSGPPFTDWTRPTPILRALFFTPSH